ncbi:hypothetical protein [Tumebacillus permanentifrigoris]|uniref:Uncharacterized protein n=1 Tax=Tumebacillus permanentifrigoris TaxID=378543 RepID=A0A316D3F7_9BACL|nr:hypothetical protein [Tumebacillus permanentifrigoris]PWK05415.1 hypothetical protein C7459_12340 [Tumebacillus permanentifrigoris]
MMEPYHRFKQSVAAGLWCTAVLAGNWLLVMFSYSVLHAFWLSVFLAGFSPIWLACYGMLLATRWRWLDLTLGVSSAALLAGWVLTLGVEGAGYRAMLIASLAGLAALATSTGWGTARLYQSLRVDARLLRVHKKDRAL